MGKASSKQAAQYTDKQPDDGIVVTSRDTAVTEDEVHAPGNTYTKRQTTKKQPVLLAFPAALQTIPSEDWCRTWAAGRTIRLRRTSKIVEEVVDKMCLPAVVRLSRSFWDDTRNGTIAEKRQFVMKQLTVATARCRITTLELPRCGMQGKDSERLAEVLFPNVSHYPRDRGLRKI